MRTYLEYIGIVGTEPKSMIHDNEGRSNQRPNIIGGSVTGIKHITKVKCYWNLSIKRCTTIVDQIFMIEF